MLLLLLLLMLQLLAAAAICACCLLAACCLPLAACPQMCIPRWGMAGPRFRLVVLGVCSLREFFPQQRER